jgi:hypothetical protein
MPDLIRHPEKELLASMPEIIERVRKGDKYIVLSAWVTVPKQR